MKKIALFLGLLVSIIVGGLIWEATCRRSSQRSNAEYLRGPVPYNRPGTTLDAVTGPATREPAHRTSMQSFRGGVRRRYYSRFGVADRVATVLSVAITVVTAFGVALPNSPQSLVSALAWTSLAGLTFRSIVQLLAPRPAGLSPCIERLAHWTSWVSLAVAALAWCGVGASAPHGAVASVLHVCG